MRLQVPEQCGWSVFQRGCEGTNLRRSVPLRNSIVNFCSPELPAPTMEEYGFRLTSPEQQADHGYGRKNSKDRERIFRPFWRRAPRQCFANCKLSGRKGGLC